MNEQKPCITEALFVRGYLKSLNKNGIHRTYRRVKAIEKIIEQPFFGRLPEGITITQQGKAIKVTKYE